MANRNQYTTNYSAGSGAYSNGGGARRPSQGRRPPGAYTPPAGRQSTARPQQGGQYAPRNRAPQGSRAPQPGRSQARPQQARPPMRNVTESAPAGRPMKDLILFATVLFVIPLLGIIGVFFTPLLWAVVVISAVCVGALWLLQCFARNTRVIMSAVLTALMVLSLVAVLDTRPKQTTEGFKSLVPTEDPIVQIADTLPDDTLPTNIEGGGGGSGGNGGGSFGGFSNVGASAQATAPIIGEGGEQTGVQASLPTATAPVASLDIVDMQQQDLTANTGMIGLPGEEAAQPPVNAAISGAQSALESYLKAWSARDYEDMLNYALPSWIAAQSAAQQQLYWNHNWWILNSWTMSTDSTPASADSATFRVVASLNKANSTKTPATLQYDALVFNQNGTWYVDPDSLRTGLAVNETPVASGDTGDGQTASGPTAAPEPTVDPSTKLWYNKDGGSYYHALQKCSTINAKYYDLMESFTYKKLGEEPYNKLSPCATCEAPKKP